MKPVAVQMLVEGLKVRIFGYMFWHFPDFPSISSNSSARECEVIMTGLFHSLSTGWRHPGSLNINIFGKQPKNKA